MLAIHILLIFVLIGFSAFFVAFEFAIVKIRTSRIDQLVGEGNKRALAVKKVITHLDEYLSACQFGITISSLGLGWLGEPSVSKIVEPLIGKLPLHTSIINGVSFVISFGLITFIHVVVGELAPKSVAIQKAELIALNFTPLLIIFYKITFPFIWLFNNSARLILRLFRIPPATEQEVAHSEEELRILLSESYKSGEINQSEYKYVNNIFDFNMRVAKEIMVPRTEMVAIDLSQSLDENIQFMSTEKYTRFPVVDGDKDHIVGLINFKDVFTNCILHQEQEPTSEIEKYIRPIIQVIESISVHDLLVKMQREHIHMAILVDEYGGTSGLVTVEDILEEIVGEIRDEFDVDEKDEILKVGVNKAIIEGKVLISEINDLFNLHIDEHDVDTIGGWILTENFDINEGDKIKFENYTFTVLSMDGHYIRSIEVERDVSKPIQEEENPT
ncbi:HlyC/CorC family transporter [Bacillus sp. RG28]|uniref:HlyC/CorC family transporter n=1 Tax=Gottfriedia endophytica TaxID=2820819 RepID=A0A940NTJ1_9BACI|nr:hemolysin family protein [Gottfriedia endophytica]MBP0726506.1 HlyC/CorC family transporter [Gottfriedia endophytica]